MKPNEIIALLKTAEFLLGIQERIAAFNDFNRFPDDRIIKALIRAWDLLTKRVPSLCQHVDYDASTLIRFLAALKKSQKDKKNLNTHLTIKGIELLLKIPQTTREPQRVLMALKETCRYRTPRAEEGR